MQHIILCNYKKAYIAKFTRLHTSAYPATSPLHSLSPSTDPSRISVSLSAARHTDFCPRRNNLGVVKLNWDLSVTQTWNISFQGDSHTKNGDMIIVCGVLYGIKSRNESNTRFRLEVKSILGSGGCLVSKWALIEAVSCSFGEVSSLGRMKNTYLVTVIYYALVFIHLK